MSIRIKREPYSHWLQRYEEVGMLIKGRIAVKHHDKWGFIDESGQEVIPCIYDQVSDFEERWFQDTYFEVLAEVEITSHQGFCVRNYGFINLQGQAVIPVVYKKGVYGHRSRPRDHTVRDLDDALEAYLKNKAPFSLLDKPDCYLFMSSRDLDRKKRRPQLKSSD